jgi:hypothetical protein
LLRQQISLGEIGFPNYELAGKDSALFHRNCFGRHISLERCILVNRYGRFGNDFTRHSSLDFDTRDADAAEKLNVRLPFHDNVLRAQASWDFSDETDRGWSGTLQIASQFSFDQRGPANYTGAAEIAFGGEMKIAARANASTEVRRDLVIAQINVRAAPRAVCRCCRIADLVFALAFKTRNDTAPLPIPKTLDSSETERLCSRRAASAQASARRERNYCRIGGTSCSWPPHSPSA